jgi:opacity protein-like surface antigen
MKKIIIAILAVSFSYGGTALAQEGDLVHMTTRRVELGFRFMPTISNFQMTAYEGGTIAGQATFGYGVGGRLGINFSEHFSVDGEILYSNLTQKYKSRDMDRSLKVQYLNIPLLFSVNTGKSRYVNLSIGAGPQFGLSLGSNVDVNSGSGPDTLTAIIDIRNNDFGVAYGGGLSFSLNEMRTIRLDIGYRGVYGLVNIASNRRELDSDSYYAFENAKVRTNAIYAGLTLCF